MMRIILNSFCHIKSIKSYKKKRNWRSIKQEEAVWEKKCICKINCCKSSCSGYWFRYVCKERMASHRFMIKINFFVLLFLLLTSLNKNLNITSISSLFLLWQKELSKVKITVNSCYISWSKCNFTVILYHQYQSSASTVYSLNDAGSVILGISYKNM